MNALTRWLAIPLSWVKSSAEFIPDIAIPDSTDPINSWLLAMGPDEYRTAHFKNFAFAPGRINCWLHVRKQSANSAVSLSLSAEGDGDSMMGAFREAYANLLKSAQAVQQ